MFYKYSESAGHYGRGGWIIFSDSCFGRDVYKVFGTEQECIDFGAKPEYIPEGRPIDTDALRRAIKNGEVDGVFRTKAAGTL